MENNRAWVLLGRKMTGEATPEELAELDRLIRKDKSVQYTLEVVSALWKERKGEMTAGEIEERYQRHYNRLLAFDSDMALRHPSAEQEAVPERDGWEEPSSRGGRWWRIAAGLLVLLATGGSIYRMLGHRNSIQAKTASLNEISTRYGSKSKVVLPDGTQVWMNAGSRLTYANDFTNAPDREVTLSGEAFFSVVHDDNHPFIIHTQSIDIRDLGTRFNVKSYPDDPTTEATLIQGSIEISIRRNPSEKIILKPNQKITLFNDELKTDTVLSPVKAIATHNQANDIYRISRVAPDPKESMIADTAWMANKLIFRSEDFATLASQLERWYNVQIRFNNETLKEYKFTGSFEDESIAQALEALQTTGSFRYKIKDDTVSIWK